MTLLEILMVVFIILLVTALGVPSFVRSFQSSKLRASARSVIMASRYARGMAVLHQQQTAILFDLQRDSLEVVVLKEMAGSAEKEAFLSGEDVAKSADEYAEEEPPSREDFSIVSELKRSMEEDVSITAVEIGEVPQAEDEIYWVNYYANGMCDEYTVQLTDKRKKSVFIEIDPISGKVTVEYD